MLGNTEEKALYFLTIRRLSLKLLSKNLQYLRKHLGSLGIWDHLGFSKAVQHGRVLNYLISMNFSFPALSTHYILEQLYFWIGSAICAGLYLKTILFVRAQKQQKNDRLKTLSKVFAAIAVTWLVCEAPNVVTKLVDPFVWMISKCNDSFYHTCNIAFCQQVSISLDLTARGAELVKNTFPVVNTVLLLVLLRPLQKPLTRCFNVFRKEAQVKSPAAPKNKHQRAGPSKK